MADPGFTVVPSDVVRLAGALLDGAGELSRAAVRFGGDAALPTEALGNLSSSWAAADMCLSVQEGAAEATEYLIEVLEGDVDRLYQVAFAYQDADEAAARDIARGMGPP
ncbi:MAG: hypothetical protein ABIW46_07615 [Acidimicrobiales bacterium]